MQLFCQSFLIFGLIFNFLICVKYAFEGRKARQPQGFLGFVAAVIITLIHAAIYWGAGMFDSVASLF